MLAFMISRWIWSICLSPLGPMIWQITPAILGSLGWRCAGGGKRIDRKSYNVDGSFKLNTIPDALVSATQLASNIVFFFAGIQSSLHWEIIIIRFLATSIINDPYELAHRTISTQTMLFTRFSNILSDPALYFSSLLCGSPPSLRPFSFLKRENQHRPPTLAEQAVFRTAVSCSAQFLCDCFAALRYTTEKR